MEKLKKIINSKWLTVAMVIVLGVEILGIYKLKTTPHADIVGSKNTTSNSSTKPTTTPTTTKENKKKGVPENLTDDPIKSVMVAGENSDLTMAVGSYIMTRFEVENGKYKNLNEKYITKELRDKITSQLPGINYQTKISNFDHQIITSENEATIFIFGALERRTSENGMPVVSFYLVTLNAEKHGTDWIITNEELSSIGV